MSLILDALKKSESERQRERAPGLQSIHRPPAHAQPRSRLPWWIVGGVLAVNVVVLGYWRWQSSAAVPKTAAVEAAPAPEPAAANAPPAASATTAAAPQSDEYTRISPAPAGSSRQPAASQIAMQNAAPILEIGELPDDVRNTLPAMTFSFHVYSANPQQRTIIINNRRMREGEEVSAGVQLQQITEDGVVLLHAGHRIHIGVLSGW